MKASMLGLAVATAAFGGSSIYLWHQLNEERANAAQVAETSRQLNARIVELEKARVHVGEQRTANANEVVVGQFGRIMPPPPPGDSAEPASAAEVTNKVWTMRRTEQTPAMAKVMRSQARAHIKRQYADVGKELGLGKERADKLIELLTEQQTAGMNEMPEFKDPAEAERYYTETQRANEQAITDLIGPDKATALKEYQETIPTRFEFDHLARQLADQDAPLTEAQSRKFLEVFLEERKRVPVPEFTAGMNEKDYMKSANAWKDDYEKRVADEASNILDAKQLSAYNEIQQWQKDMRDQMLAAGISIPPAGHARPVMGVNTMMYSTAAPAFVSGTIVNEGAPAPDQKEKKP